jgi:phage FluMu gp28-like protein
MDDGGDTAAAEPAMPVPHAGQQQILAMKARVRVAVCGRRFGKTYAAGIAAIEKCVMADAKRPARVWWIAPVQAQASAVEREVAGWVVRKGKSEKANGKSNKESSATEDTETGGGTRQEAGGERPEGSSNSELRDSKETEKGDTKTADGEACGENSGGANPESGIRNPESVTWTHRKTAHVLECSNGSRIEFHSAHVPDRLRGAGLDLVIVDEAADVSEYAWQAVIRPMLLDRQGQAFIIGTPRGTRNWLHGVYLLGQNPEHEGNYASVRMPTSASNRINTRDLDEFRVGMREDEFRQEYEAEFLDSVGAVFSNVASAVDGEAIARGRPGETYITGIDLGDRQDYTVLVSISVQTERAEGFARFNQLGWNAQVERIAEHLKLFPGACVVDETGVGDPVFQQLRAVHRGPSHGEWLTPELKERMVRGISIGLEQKTLKLANVKQLLDELQAFQVLEEQRGAMGFRKYGAPEGLHDDCVIALGLAWHGLKTGQWAAHRRNPWQRGIMA